MKTTKKTTKRVAKKPVVKPQNDLYCASIKVLGRVYTTNGGSAREAIENLKVGNVAKGMSVLTVSKGDVAKTKVLPSPQTFRLFSASRLMREIALKNVSLMFDGI